MEYVVLVAAIAEECREALTARLGRDDVHVASSEPAELMQRFRTLRPAVVLLGSSLADEHRLSALSGELRDYDGRVAIIVLADHESEALAVAALRAGINDYFRAPFSIDELTVSVRRCLGKAASAPGPASPRFHTSPHASGQFVGQSAAMRELRASLEKVAATQSNVLITGETGTGKELAARLIHSAGSRRHRPFVPVNCAAIPDTLLESELFGHERGAFTGAAVARAGLLQQAQGGTVFLDEIGDTSPVAQAKLLRAIESREIVPLGGRASVPLDVRVIAATNQELESAVRHGRFRKDLFFRLNVVRIHLSPLREHSVDVPALVVHYSHYFARRAGRQPNEFTDEALSSLQRHSWPGNVRELKNLVESLFAFAVRSRIDVEDLPRDLVDGLPAPAPDLDAERQRVLGALVEARWNKSRAARQLRCSRMTLYRRMTRLGLDDEE